MGTSHRDSRGFTLIAALLLTVLLSGVAVGLLYMVSNEARMGGNDLEGNLAYYGAEAGIENLTSQLSTLYQSSQSPDAASINALTSPSNLPDLRLRLEHHEHELRRDHHVAYDADQRTTLPERSRTPAARGTSSDRDPTRAWSPA